MNIMIQDDEYPASYKRRRFNALVLAIFPTRFFPVLIGYIFNIIRAKHYIGISYIIYHIKRRAYLLNTARPPLDKWVSYDSMFRFERDSMHTCKHKEKGYTYPTVNAGITQRFIFERYCYVTRECENIGT